MYTHPHKGPNRWVDSQTTAPTQTASLPGTFEVLSKQELREHGVFAAILSKNFESPIFGGWTLELNFNKPVFE